MQENEPGYSSSDCAVLVGDHNVAGYALSARARAPLTLEGSDKIFHHSGGNRVQACGRLVIHHYLWVGHMCNAVTTRTCYTTHGTTLVQQASAEAGARITTCCTRPPQQGPMSSVTIAQISYIGA